MVREKGLFWRSMQPLIGSVIGVGIFGLPYVFGQAGFGIGLIHLLVLGVVNALLLLMYADIIRNTEGHPRFSGLVKEYVGAGWSHVASAILFSASWGAMTAYVIVAGEFLHALFSPLIGGSQTLYSILFYAICAFLVIGGLGFISKLEVAFVLALLLMLSIVMIGSAPAVDPQNLLYVNAENWFLPFGVMLFAFGGIAAVPEMAEVLGKRKNDLLGKSIIVGMVIVAVVYILFAGIVAGVSGVHTSEEAVVGLGAAVGDWVLVFGSIIGIFSVFTSFLILAISIMDTIIYDYKQRYMLGWFIAVIVPLVVFLLGARSFIGVIGFVGGVLSSCIGLLTIYTYIRAKKNVCLPKRCLRIPNWVLIACTGVFAFGLVYTIISSLS